MNFFEKYKNYLLLHFIVLIFGGTAILGRLISIPSTNLVFFRMSIAFLGLLAFLFIVRWDFKTPFKNKLKFLATGLVTAAHWIFFFESVVVSNVSICLATMSSVSLFVAFVEPLVFRRKLRLMEVLFGGLIIVGLVLIFSFETEYVLGIVYGLISSFLAAVFGTLNGHYVQKGHEAHTITLYEMLGGVVGISVYFAFTGAFGVEFFQVPSSDWVWILILAIVCTTFAFVASVYVMKDLSPFTVALAINMEPVYGILMALFIFKDDEYMSTGFYFGALIIIGTIIANAIYKKRLKKQGEAELG